MLIDNTELKKLILENPDLPLLFFATEDANGGEFSTELASARFRKGIVLDYPQEDLPNDERVYNDKDDLEHDLINRLADEDKYTNLSDDEFNEVVKAHMEEYEPYWKECIIITVDACWK